MKDLATFSRTVLKFTFFATLFITPFVFASYTSELFEIPKTLFVYTLTSTFVCFYFLYCLAVRKVLVTRNIVLIFFLIFTLITALSTLFSIDRHLSVFGYYTRLNGSLVTSACYLTIFFIVSTVLSKKEAIEGLKFLVLSTVIVSLWGIPGHFGYDPNCYILTGKFTSTCWREEFRPTLRIFSTFGQPNWLGAFLTMTMPIALSIVFTTKGFQKIFFLLSSQIILLGLIFSNSRSSFLSLIISLLLFFAFLGIRKTKANLPVIVIFLFLSILLLSLFGKPLWERNLEAIRQNLFFSQKSQPEKTTVPEINNPPTPKPPASTSLEAGGTESGTIRIIVWKGAINIFKNFPILGTGPETFATTYYRYRPVEHNQTTEWNFLYNKAHNEYLNYLSNTGLLGFLAYSALLVSIGFLIIKNILRSQNQTRIIQIGLLSSSVSYLVVNFFGFSVIATSVTFFLIPAISFAISEHKSELTLKIPKKIFVSNSLVVAAIFILFLFLLVTISRIFLSDTYYARYQKEIGSGKILKALKNIQTAAETSPYFEPLYYAELGYAASLAAENSFDNDKKSQTELAEKSTALALGGSPNNLSLWRKAQSTYFELSLSDSKYLSLALNAGKITTELAPTDPAGYFNLGLIQKTAGQKNEARDAFSKALELKPDYTEAKEELAKLD